MALAVLMAALATLLPALAAASSPQLNRGRRASAHSSASVAASADQTAEDELTECVEDVPGDEEGETLFSRLASRPTLIPALPEQPSGLVVSNPPSHSWPRPAFAPPEPLRTPPTPPPIA